MPDPFQYPGEELALFEKAMNWKRYFSSFIKPFIKGKVLEAGAGLGANTILLHSANVNEWILLEPDPAMAAILAQKIKEQQLPADCRLLNDTITSLGNEPKFDTIIYIDVLEHIEADKEELQTAVALLKPGGHLIVLSPAFPFLFSPFDKAIGHYRRYTRSSIKKIIPASLSQVRLHYFDTTGFLLSAMNRIFLKQKYPTQQQIHAWDRYGIPLSCVTDKILFYSFGKSILGIWQKQDRQLN